MEQEERSGNKIYEHKTRKYTGLGWDNVRECYRMLFKFNVALYPSFRPFPFSLHGWLRTMKRSDREPPAGKSSTASWISSICQLIQSQSTSSPFHLLARMSAFVPAAMTLLPLIIASPPNLAFRSTSRSIACHGSPCNWHSWTTYPNNSLWFLVLAISILVSAFRSIYLLHIPE